ncbi:hypothetical protein [Microbulbifer litoralis]|uniref:hypothetical protein n=1 Tax=Microbulbifer litoralis TaxID=2933965 RepID=UPI002027F435|nr:hypothetical protein [Microbulbifer sp. GX H0434]
MKGYIALWAFRLFIAWTLSVAPGALAETLFYCETEGGKKVEVQDLGSLINYRFGKKLYDPEMELTLPRERATTYQWPGAGPTESYSVFIPNGKIVYIVYTSRERRPGGEMESGILVRAGGVELATINCKPDTLFEKLMGVDLPKER